MNILSISHLGRTFWRDYPQIVCKSLILRLITVVMYSHSVRFPTSGGNVLRPSYPRRFDYPGQIQLALQSTNDGKRNYQHDVHNVFRVGLRSSNGGSIRVGIYHELQQKRIVVVNRRFHQLLGKRAVLAM